MTFVVSMIERVIEERARGDLSAAVAIRAEVNRLVGDDLARLKPGSVEAAHLKQVLIEQGAWSQYLEVGIGPDAEIFTKAQRMAAVGTGMDAGIHPNSSWNNPEPEVVLAVSSAGRIVAPRCTTSSATWRADPPCCSARRRTTMPPARSGRSCRCSMRSSRWTTCGRRMSWRQIDRWFDLRRDQISRNPADLVVQTVNPHHPYPDGAVLFLGMMFAPVEDRDAPGKGFTHKAGDIVTISASKLGRLVNRMMPTDRCEPGNSASVRRCEISPGANCCDSRFQPCRRTCGKPTALTERSLVILTAIVRPGLPRSSA